MIKKKKQSNSVADMAADILDDPSAKGRVVELIRDRKMITQLIIFRLQRGVTMEKVAKKMGITLAELEVIEAGSDTDLKPGVFSRYLSALGYRSIEFSDAEVKMKDDGMAIVKFEYFPGEDNRGIGSIPEEDNPFGENLFIFLKPEDMNGNYEYEAVRNLGAH